VIVYAGTAGYTDKLPVESLKAFEQDLYRYIDEKHPELWTDIKTKRELTDDIKKTLDKALKTFVKKFAATGEE
jgi:F-type H+-transporting ATPase subunit alpha